MILGLCIAKRIGLVRYDHLLPILLHPRCSKTGQTMLIDGALPAKEFLNCQSVFLARFFKAQQATANGSNNFGLASDHPPSCIFGW
ncbi:hypothetical protein SAMN04515647_1321 [Cohaesibacter sp. ES.047]|nr:hypothetical protein SAMN04515647_1321 [Cohaesibacter sp. ES.047]